MGADMAEAAGKPEGEGAGNQGAGKNGKSKSNPAEAFTKSFDQYEYVAVITPGATLLFGLLLIWPNILPDDALSETSVGTLGLFLIAAYIVGQILRAIGDVAEQEFWYRRHGGMPSEWVLYADSANAQSLLEPNQRLKMRERATALYKTDFSALELKPTDARAQHDDICGKWQGVTRQIANAVRKAGQSFRVDAFNRTYGLMVGITIAMLAIAAAGLFGSVSAGARGLLVALLALIIAGFAAYRAYVFGKLYARELFVNFIDLPPPV
jgi:hypothetical protein